MVFNHYHGAVELIYDEKTVILESGKGMTMNEEEIASIPKHKKYLFDGFLTALEIIEKSEKQQKK